MRRAVSVLLLIAALPFFALGDSTAPVDAIGMLDYRRGPHFKVGDWVKYAVRGSSLHGYKTDYTVTILIGGEELWWGEECFWVETHTSHSGQEPHRAASLLSYAVFQDSLPAVRFKRYIRKFIDALDEDGKAAQQLYRRQLSDLVTRGYSEYEPVTQKDTVGVQQVIVPKGTFDALGVEHHRRSFITEHKPDSSVYFEKTIDHTYWTSDQIPITGLVRVDMVDTQRSRVWVVGESENAPLRVLEQATGSKELVDFGTGMKAQLVPEFLRQPLSEQRPKRPPRPAARKAAGTRG